MKSSNLKFLTFFVLLLLQASCASFSPESQSGQKPASIIDVSRDVAKVRVEQQLETSVGTTQEKVTQPKAAKTHSQQLSSTGEAVSPKEKANPISNEIFARPGSTVDISGDSTLRKYSSHATEIGLRVSVTPPIQRLEDLINEKLTEFILVVPVAGMKSGNGTLDEHLREALKANKYSDIRGAVKSFKSHGQSADGFYRVTAMVALDIAGKETTVPIDATLKVEGSNLRIKGEKQLLMTDFDIKPPTLMLGTIKTANEIKIAFNFILGLKNKVEDSKNNKQGSL